MLLYLYILSFGVGAVSASVSNPLERAGIAVDNTNTRILLGNIQRAVFVSMLVYPFLVFKWYVGIVVFVSFALVLPLLLFRLPAAVGARADNLLLFLAKIKPLFDVVSSVVTVYLWINYFIR